jgi:hypothetical protein
VSSNTDLAVDLFVVISNIHLEVFVTILRVIDLVDLVRYFWCLSEFGAGIRS